MVSVKRGKTQNIGKFLLQLEVWSWVEKIALSGWGTRQIALHLIGLFPKIREHYRYDENPTRAQDALGRLIRYHMQDELRIDLNDYLDDLDGQEMIKEHMSRFQFNWERRNEKMSLVPVHTWAISSLTRRRAKARLRHPFYSPFFSPYYDEYRPLRDDGGAEASPFSGFYYRDSST